MIKKDMDETNQGFMKYLGGLDLKKIEVGNQYFNDEDPTVDEPEETLELPN